MPLEIKDKELIEMIEVLASKRRVSQNAALREALRFRLGPNFCQRRWPTNSPVELTEVQKLRKYEIMALAEKISQFPYHDHRCPDEMVFDENGVPSV